MQIWAYKKAVSRETARISSLLCVNLRYMPDKIDHLAAIAPLVIIPCDKLYKVGVKTYAGGSVKRADMRVRIEIA